MAVRKPRRKVRWKDDGHWCFGELPVTAVVRPGQMVKVELSPKGTATVPSSLVEYQAQGVRGGLRWLPLGTADQHNAIAEVTAAGRKPGPSEEWDQPTLLGEVA